IADTPPLCDYYLGGIVTKGNVKIAISTNGKSPTTAKRLREFFEEIIPGLDSRMLNGGVILTGGGSQLKHLIQLTEYITGLNARIGLPNEHLAPNHIEELKKPMYSTCIGLILKGYNDYEQNYKVFTETFKKVEVPKSLTVNNTGSANGLTSQRVEPKPVATTLTPEQIEKRKSKFWDRFKNNLIEIFSEEDDKLLP
ncbi:MAG: hypothetical protein ACEQR6_05375, partial [Burkholderiaceae bacterium]